MDVLTVVHLIHLVSAYGVAYTRWGRRDCAGGAEMVYNGIRIRYDIWENCVSDSFLFNSGYAAGGHNTITGGGSNYICLHSNVTYTAGGYVSGSQGGYMFIDFEPDLLRREKIVNILFS